MGMYHQQLVNYYIDEQNTPIIIEVNTHTQKQRKPERNTDRYRDEVVVMELIGKKRAVLIGCNYAGSKIELRGCVNDVRRMHTCLVDRFGFSHDDITVLVDSDHSCVQPTGKNIRRAIMNMVRSAQEGDVMFIHYSGHGTRLPAETGQPDDTGFDECIVPCDMNLIIGITSLPTFSCSALYFLYYVVHNKFA